MKKGFTLIEILIVVAIIAILASVVLVGLGPTQQAGRDARRVSDIHEIQNGLELYYNKCGFYPGTANCGAATIIGGQTETGGTYYNTMGADLVGTAGIGVSSIPSDPINTNKYVYLFAENTTAPATTYVIQATMENGSGTVFDGYNPPTLPSNPSGDTISTCAAPEYCVTL